MGNQSSNKATTTPASPSTDALSKPSNSNQVSTFGEQPSPVVNPLTRQNLLGLQRSIGNRALGRLLARTAGDPSPRLQRQYRYVGAKDITKMGDLTATNMPHVWTGIDGIDYLIDRFEVKDNQVKLVMHPASGVGLTKEFIVPRMVKGWTFHEVAQDGVVYVDKNKTNAEKVKDLSIFTNYIPGTNVNSLFPELKFSEEHNQFLNTTFASRVVLVPLETGASSEFYKANQIWVQQVKISDDRPPTQFGKEGQKSHTVAWTLLRAALQNLSNQTLDNFIVILMKMLNEISLPKGDEAAAATKTLLVNVKLGLDKFTSPTASLEIWHWQRAASELLTKYVHAYQLSEAATYKDGRAIGHAEPMHMSMLRIAEMKLREGKTLDKETLVTVCDSAFGMLDFKNRLGDRMLGQIFHHWITSLHLAFPLLMRTHHKEIIQKLVDVVSEEKLKQISLALGHDLTQPIAEVLNIDPAKQRVTATDMELTSLNAANQSTFVANIYVVPSTSGVNQNTEVRNGSDSKVSDVRMGVYPLDAVKIQALEIADDRPDTRFGNLQRSHTVAWTLIRRHLISFGGHPVQTLVKFLMHELHILQTDIDSPEKNKYIKFQAAKTSGELMQKLLTIGSNPDGYPIHLWQSRLSDAVEAYITLYQLSQSATYSKEERPSSHGESSAIAMLDTAEELFAKGEKEAESYLTKNRVRLVKHASKLVDAAVATSSLPPSKWQIAINHFLKIMDHKYKHLMAQPDFKKDMLAEMTVLEPKDELVEPYGKPREIGTSVKAQINLFENAKNEVRTLETDTQRDLSTSLRLNLSSFDPPDPENWDKMTKTLIDVKKMASWTGDYFASIKSYTARPKRRETLSLPTPETVKNMAIAVQKCYTQLDGDKDFIINMFFEQMSSEAKGTGNDDYIEKNNKSIREVLGKSLARVNELSLAKRMENYQHWFTLLTSITSGTTVDYDSISTALNKDEGKKEKPAKKNKTEDATEEKVIPLKDLEIPDRTFMFNKDAVYEF